LRAVEEAVEHIAPNLATINAKMAKMQRSVTSLQKTLESFVQKTPFEDILALTLSLQARVEEIATRVPPNRIAKVKPSKTTATNVRKVPNRQ
jgi:hypothetical protein